MTDVTQLVDRYIDMWNETDPVALAKGGHIPSELDYTEELMASGFNLRNPNVKRTCGCGSSFVV